MFVINPSTYDCIFVFVQYICQRHINSKTLFPSNIVLAAWTKGGIRQFTISYEPPVWKSSIETVVVF